MAIDLQRIAAELAATPAPVGGGGDPSFEFYNFPFLRVQYGTSQAPISIKAKLLSWPPDAPPEKGLLAPRVLMHFKMGQSGNGSCICPKMHDPAAPCPVCEYVAEAQHGSELVRKAAFEMAQKERFWFMLLNITEIEQSSGQVVKVYVWNAPPVVYRQTVTLACSGFGDFSALQDSYLVQLSGYKDGKSRGGKVNISGLPEKRTISLEAIAKLLPDYERLLASPPVRVIENMLFKSPSAPQGLQRRYSSRASGVVDAPIVATQPVMAPAVVPAPSVFAAPAVTPAAPMFAPTPTPPAAATAAPSLFVSAPPAVTSGGTAPVVAPAAAPVVVVQAPAPVVAPPTVAVQPSSGPTPQVTTPKRSLDDILGRKKT
jgi:hypothetical protein